MDQESIKNEMRLYVVEWFVATNFAMTCLQADPASPLKAFGQARDQMLGGARLQTFSGVDPAMSDLLSAELESALSRLVTMASEQINVVLKARGN